MNTRKKRESKIRQEIQKKYEENELASLTQIQNRARSFSVGTASGGVIELNMRGDFANLWYILQPVEAVEIIEQLAAAAGLEILKRPKQDFSAWRSWDFDQPDSSSWKGAAPWQISDKEKRKLGRLHEQKYGILPTVTSTERPRLEASTRRKNKAEKETEE